MKYTKKVTAWLLAGCMCFGMMTGCGKKEIKEAKAKVDMQKLQEAMLTTQDDLPEMTTISSKDDSGEELFATLSDMEYDKIQDYFYSHAADGKASEVAVVFMKDEADVDEMLDDLREFKDGRVKTYENYSPDQVEIAEQAVVFAKGNYVCYIMNEKFSHIKATFEKAMDESE
ncbi:MAG: DUF4358 domain-containing protein [Lachnospiraceae bacterium]|jgi:5-hydroxyisourate hydrolase-like protein (transthyretin family)|nr:DUF4358 domain-containing protein [Lachnospiraceae bacterium]